MSNRWKRRYPGRGWRVLAGVVGLVLGLWLVVHICVRPVTANDLDPYYRNILKTHSSSPDRDIAFIYAIGLESSAVSFKTPKRFVLSQFLGFERVDVSEGPGTGLDNYGSRPICTVFYADGFNAQYIDRHGESSDSNTDDALGRAAISTYIRELAGRSEDDQFTMCVTRHGEGYHVSVDYMPVRQDLAISEDLDKDFSPPKPQKAQVQVHD